MFPLRNRLLRGCSRQVLEGLRLTIPDDLDWIYFQCAPADQRLRTLRGDEWLELEGLSEAPRLRTRLPGARAEVRIFAPDRARAPKSVALVADMLRIDADRRQCSLVWRGTFPLHDEGLADELVVVGRCARGAEAAAWPETIEQLPLTAFQQPMPAGGSSDATPGSVQQQRTVVLTDVEPEGSSRSAEADGGTAEQPRGATRLLSAEELARAQAAPEAPFALRPPGAPRGADASATASPIPGAPWSDEPLATVPRPPGTLMETVALPPSPRPAAEAKARLEAELEARQAADAKARLEAELKAREGAEAEARRAAAAQAFALEQAEARRAEAERAAKELEDKKQAAKRLGTKIYGGFRKKT
jgi:hypothetical protein